MDDVADRAMDFFHGIFAAQNQEQHPRLLAADFAREILQHVIADQLLGRAVPRLSLGHDRLGVPLR